MREVAGPSNAETRIDVVSRAGAIWQYALEPVTGRKHQLRVHMAALGAPIVDDRWYPTLLDQAPDDHARPLRLLAERLTFVDPITGEDRWFESRLV
jgi:tRNA pseudouridine32 synthase/23S rRNA pseudouridine746 synthase